MGEHTKMLWEEVAERSLSSLRRRVVENWISQDRVGFLDRYRETLLR